MKYGVFGFIYLSVREKESPLFYFSNPFSCISHLFFVPLRRKRRKQLESDIMNK